MATASEFNLPALMAVVSARQRSHSGGTNSQLVGQLPFSRPDKEAQRCGKPVQAHLDEYRRGAGGGTV